MMAKEIVVDLIALSGGELIGRTRLQKEVYLLHRCGGDFAVDFVYHYFGPYSFEIADAIDDACRENSIKSQIRTGRYEIPYTIFRTARKSARPQGIGSLSGERASVLIQSMKNVSDIVLELAATIVFLRDAEGYSCRGAVEETIARKPLKATKGRIDRALKLIDNLGISSASL